MGQEEVIKFLRRQKKPKTCREIAQKLGDDHIKIAKIIRKLLEHKEIHYIEMDRFEAYERCNSFRRARLYYIGQS